MESISSLDYKIKLCRENIEKLTKSLVYIEKGITEAGLVKEETSRASNLLFNNFNIAGRTPSNGQLDIAAEDFTSLKASLEAAMTQVNAEIKQNNIAISNYESEKAKINRLNASGSSSASSSSSSSSAKASNFTGYGNGSSQSSSSRRVGSYVSAVRKSV